MSLLVEVMPVGMAYLVVGILAAFAIIWCYFGFKFYKVMAGVNGFLFGVIFSSELLTEIFRSLKLDSSNSFILIAIACVGIGLLFGFLALRYYYVGLFLIGALAGYFVPAIFTSLSGIICLGVAVIVGLLMGFMGKYLIILISAISGGVLLAECICFATRDMIAGSGKNILLIVLSLLFIVTGAIAQFKCKNKKKSPD